MIDVLSSVARIYIIATKVFALFSGLTEKTKIIGNDSSGIIGTIEHHSIDHISKRHNHILLDGDPRPQHLLILPHNKALQPIHANLKLLHNAHHSIEGEQFGHTSNIMYLFVFIPSNDLSGLTVVDEPFLSRYVG